MNSKHTPGPWEASRYNGNGPHWNIRNGHHGCIVANVFHFVGSITGTSESFDGEKNARLIAAAPKLLEALESLVAELTERTHEDGRMMSASYVRGEVCKVSTLESAKAAIAKAKGEA